MTTREDRQKELESIARSPGGPDRIFELYIQLKGKMAPIESLVVQDLVPEILDAEFPESAEPSAD